MKKRTVNKLLSFALAAVMLFTLLPGVTVNGATKQKSDQPTVASTDVSAVVDMNGHTTVTITDSMVSGLIDQAREQAETDDRTANGVGIQLNAAAGAAAKIIAITITANAIERLNSEDVKLFALVTPLVNISFNAAAIKEINTQATGDVTVTITPEDKLSDEAKGYIGSRPVYNVSVSYQKSGVTSFITDLKGGAVTLGITYTPASDEKRGSLFAVYVPKSGKPELLNKSSYNDGHVILTSNTLSVYGVGYKTPAPVFTDTANHWAKDNIDFAVSRGLLSGTSDTAFSPDTAVTRGMFITALGRLSGADMSGYTKSSFSDVAEGSYYLPYIEWAVESKIVSGVGNGKFAPDKTITRQEIAIMTANYAASAGYTLPVVREVVTYADNASISARAKAAVKALQQAGVISGVDNNRFNPKGTATRAEAATILRNFTELVIDTGTAKGWSQNETGQWMYYNQSGKKVTGWLTTSGGSYYFNTNGKLAVSVSNSPTSSTYDSVTGTVTTEDNSGVSFIGWCLSSNGANYTDTDGFTDITETGKFTVSSNGWYAVGIVDGVGNFSYMQIQITDISTASRGSSGGGSIGGGTTISVPSVPQSLTTTPGDGQVALTWTAPTSNGGSGITKYQVQKDSDTWVDVMSGLTYTFTGLTNGQSYTFQVRAVNSVGSSEAATTTATPQAAATVPSSPQNFTAIPGNGQVTITWTDPVNNGGSTITKYQVQQDNGSWIDITGSLTYTFVGLTNGTSYTFMVRAVNSVGNGAETTTTATPQPAATVLSAPQSLVATPGDGQVSLIWTAPVSDGGSAITKYQVKQNNGAWIDITGSLTYTFTGLTNGTSCTFMVRAVNSVGNGAEVTTTATPQAIATVPSAPQSLAATPGDGQVLLIWTAPTSDGGSAITKYQVRQDNGEWIDITGSLTYNFTGLTNDTSYTFKVRAVNAVGNGTEAAITAMPQAATTASTAPQSLVATPGDGQVSLTWTAPASDGGSAITKYQVRQDSGEWIDITGSLTYNFTGLTNDTSYTFKVRAVNAVGNGTEAAITAMPQAATTAPTEPQSLVATPGDGQVSLTWTAPASDGGSAIIKYQVRQDSGEWIDITGSLTYNFTGLTNDTSYTFKVRVVNAVGNGTEAAITAMPQAAYTINSINILAAGGAANVTRNATLQFSAVVNGTGSPPQTVTWSVVDAISATTTIVSGLLTVAADETAVSLKVVATSTEDTSISGELTITVLPFAGGDGSQGSPYQIDSAAGLAAMANDLTAHYILTDDITVTTWTPIGDSGNRFTGILEGNGQVVTFDNVNFGTGYQRTGLFGYISSGGKVKNLTVAGALTTEYSGSGSNAIIGGVTGTLFIGGTIENCAVSASVSATGGSNVFAGGVVGYNNGTITNCYATGAVTSTARGTDRIAYAGGLVGQNVGTITSSYATSTVTSTADGLGVCAGGVAGQNGGTITNCYATGTVAASSTRSYVYGGGVTGSNGGTITNCYATGAVTSTAINVAYAGGVAGNNTGGITNCAALNGSVSAAVDVGGTYTRRVAGDNSGGTLTNTYANSAMRVNNVTVTDDTSNPENTINGAGVGSHAISAQSWWSSMLGWTFSIGGWSWESDCLPYLNDSHMIPISNLSMNLTRMLLPQTVTLTLGTSGNGAASHDGEYGDTFLVGDTVTITAKPDEGYVFVEWWDENDETVSADAVYSFEIIEDMTLTAVFTLTEETQEQGDNPADTPDSEDEPEQQDEQKQDEQQQDADTDDGDNTDVAPEPEPAILPQDEDESEDTGDNTNISNEVLENNDGSDGLEAIEE